MRSAMFRLLRKYEGVPPVETRKPIRFSLSLAGKLDGDDRSGDKGSMVKNGDSTMECLIQSCGDDMDAVRRCLVAGYFANAAKLGSDGRYHTLRGTVPATLHKTCRLLAARSVLPEWVIYNEVASGEDERNVHDRSERVVVLREVTRVHPRWLVTEGANYYSLHEQGS